jgi:thiamine biosynthesis lipoprotein
MKLRLPGGLRNTILILLVLLSLGACSKPQYEFNETVFTFGTLVEITIVGSDEQTANRAYTAALDDLNYMHSTWHAWQHNALSRINSLLKTGGSFSLAPSVQPLITQAKTLSRQSNGLFNPAIGELINLWGFHSDERDDSPPPLDENIKALLDAAPSMDDVVIEGLSMRGTNKHLRLDFGGFAKGVAVDVVINHLREFGIGNAIVNAGGDLRAIGDKYGRPWRIGIRNPNSEGVIASIDIEGDESVFTSGDYERYFEDNGKRYHHIIDPRTGYPAANTRSVTVLHDSGAVADAASTALFVAGPNNWPDIARSMDIQHVMLIASDGRVQMSRAMAKRIRFENGFSPEVTVIDLTVKNQ